MLRSLVLLVAIACSGRAIGPTPAPSQAAAAGVQEASFEHAWSRIGATYPDPAMKGLDWEGARIDLLPEARAAQTNADLRPVLRRLFDQLGESHFGILEHDVLAEVLPEDSAPQGTGMGGGHVGIDLRLIEGAMRVVEVRPDSPAAQAGIGLGWVLEAVDTWPIGPLITRLSASVPDPRSHAWHTRRRTLAALSGPTSTAVDLSLRLPDGSTERRTLLRAPPEGDRVGFGHLPPVEFRFEHRILASDDGDLGYVRFNMFLGSLGPDFSNAVLAFIAHDVRGIVLDLRGNPGGIVPFARGIAGHLVADPGRSLGRMQTREASLNLLIHPRPDHQRFDGPVAVILDACSASTSEILAAGLQELGRVQVFGEVSAGAALPSFIEALPNGDGLQFVMADLHTPRGVRVEGAGVQPDHPVSHTAASLAAGQDAMLAAAAAWLRAQETQ